MGKTKETRTSNSSSNRSCPPYWIRGTREAVEPLPAAVSVPVGDIRGPERAVSLAMLSLGGG